MGLGRPQGFNPVVSLPVPDPMPLTLMDSSGFRSGFPLQGEEGALPTTRSSALPRGPSGCWHTIEGDLLIPGYTLSLRSLATC